MGSVIVAEDKRDQMRLLISAVLYLRHDLVVSAAEEHLE